MNNIKTEFSIKDLENLSGIKAHTIRIWEKRYSLFKPNRTETNIRYYSTESLQKLLNVSFLKNNGYKISKIAGLKNEDMASLVKELSSKAPNFLDHDAINDFKLSMLTFDQHVFSKTYNKLITTKTFKEIFYDVFIPLLNDIGLLWQTDTITPAHEHFISTKIKQKILLNIERIEKANDTANTRTFVLFLPLNEIHDIGLLFIDYELICKGYQTLFLGQSIPVESLKDLLKFYDNISFVSYFTIKPENGDIESYLKTFNQSLLNNSSNELLILGQKTKNIDTSKLPKNIKTFSSIKEVVKEL